MRDGTWWCEVRIQDGTERWSKPTRLEAVRSVISGARVLNGSYITEKDISFHAQEEPVTVVRCGPQVSDGDLDLLQKIKNGYKVVLDFDDPRIKYRISKEDCDLIVKIREGDVEVIPGAGT